HACMRAQSAAATVALLALAYDSGLLPLLLLHGNGWRGAGGFVPTGCCPQLADAPFWYYCVRPADAPFGAVDWRPCSTWTDISQANIVSFESDYGCPGLDTCKGIHYCWYMLTLRCHELRR
ncbi:hypothetical protein Tco_0982977, partial [Tanacetum coccineum]